MKSKAIQDAIESEMETMCRAHKKVLALALFDEVPGISWGWVREDYSKPMLADGWPLVVSLTLARDVEARETLKAILKASGAKRADKTFDEKTGQVVYAIQGLGVRIELKAGAPTACEVERVIETIDVPEEIKPAHQEERVIYRLVDPACIDGGRGKLRSIAEPDLAQDDADAGARADA